MAATDATMTFDEATRTLEADASLSPGRRRDLVSALTSAARLLGLPPAAVPCDPAFLKPRLLAIHPLQAGIGKGRLANIRSGVRRALLQVGRAGCGGDARPLGPEWSAAMAGIADRWLAMRLVRLARFCAAAGIGPAAVDRAVIERFRAEAHRSMLGGTPRHTVRKLIGSWNAACETVPDWPGRVVTAGWSGYLYGLPLSAFPASFRKDVDAWVALVDGSRLFEDQGPVRPLRPATIKTQVLRIRLAASALVRCGRAPESILGLADLVQPDAAKAILGFHLKRADGKPTGAIHGTASLLLAIARHHVHAEDTTIAALKRLAAKVSSRTEGLTAKNRARLAQFDDERNVARLLHLPSRLMAQAEAAARPVEAARLALFAVAIELLLHCPIRLANLVALDLDRHLVRSGSGRRATVHLRIPPEAVKNREAIEFHLPAELVAMLDRYVARFRPAFARAGAGWLFPNPQGGKRDPQGFSAALKKLVRDETGLEVTTHGFRHIAAKLHLDRHPGEYETIRRILGHASIDTTTRNYTGMETVQAGRHFDRTILDLRQDTALLARADRRGKR